MKLNKKSKIYIAGHNGMVGSSLLRILKKRGFNNIITIEKKFLDLRDQVKVHNFFKKTKPEFVICAAAKVAGIFANNKYKADFLYDNLTIQNNVIYESFLANVKKLIFLGSSCVYPSRINRPIKENDLLTGLLEKTNEPYAIAKIAGIKLCESLNSQYKTNFLSLMPCNLYGPNDNYDLSSSHFFPALIRKCYEASQKNKKEIILWGDGSPKRELMHVDDLASACIYFLGKNTKENLINVGSGHERSIKEYLQFIMSKHNYNFKIKFDRSKPNGMKRKIINSSIAKKYGWSSKISLNQGYQSVYLDFLKKSYN